MKESLRTFMNGLIDYAGLFPPADLPLNEAIEEYVSQLKSDNCSMLSRFIIHTSKLNDLDEFLPLFNRARVVMDDLVQDQIKIIRENVYEDILLKITTRRTSSGAIEGFVITFDDLTDLVKNFGAKGLAYFKCENVNDLDAGIISPIKKFLDEDVITEEEFSKLKKKILN